MHSLRVALAFLTRIPLTPSTVNFPAPSIGGWFPIAGLVIGTLVGAVYWVATLVLPPLPAAAVAIGVGILITGAFHEDGLADTFDALGGGLDTEAVLRIFKDSRLGTFGVAALSLSILLRVTLLGSLGATAGFLALVVAHSLGRGVAASAMGFARPASSGLGTSLMAGFTRRQGLMVAVLTLVIAVVLVGGAGAIGFAVAVAAAAILVRWATNKAGGITGDVLGAIEQCGEIAVLLAVVATIEYWMIPWWS
ncbi:MAG: adenosylcobinamide-GDP ribazoletransferase [Acidimicrobiia bacterium]|nr:adenosylcobinamide-GDP ribazoletransferase [Acidimicrobiia bacterium]